MNVEQLSKLSDDELREKLGMNHELAKAKDAIAKLASLDGEERKEAEKQVKDMFAPQISPWRLEDAVRCAKKKSAMEEQMDCSPCSIC